MLLRISTYTGVEEDPKEIKEEKSVTRGSAENSINPMPCCMPTIELPDDDKM